MRKLIFFSFCATLLSAACAQKKTISSKITCIQPYCGGARPTPQMEADAQKPKPYASKMIIIVSDKGKVDSAKTDASGLLKKKLDQGTYKLFETWRYYKSTPNGEDVSHFDKACLEEEWKKEFRKISINKNKIVEESVNEINMKCDWSQPCQLDQFKPPRRQ
jgi:hypothetical protein